MWHRFADKYVEQTKERKEEAFPTLLEVYTTCLKLLHPFMPFVTEAVWQEFRNSTQFSGLSAQMKPEKMLIVSGYPSGV
jgi:valyl-tRNA synthetase